MYAAQHHEPAKTKTGGANVRQQKAPATPCQLNPLWHSLATHDGRRVGAASGATPAVPAVQRLCKGSEAKLSDASKNIQTQLTVGAVGDRYEQEADAAAEQVMASATHEDSGEAVSLVPIPPIQRMCAAWQPELEEGHGPVQAKAGTNARPGPVTPTLDTFVKSPGSGTPFTSTVAERIEPVLGADLSPVRVHSGAAAQAASQSLGARAFTHRYNIFLGQGESVDDLRLMAHEATHVVQQSGWGERIQRDPHDPPEGEREPYNEEATLSVDARAQLEQHRIRLSDDDEALLARDFTYGFSLQVQDLYVLVPGDTRADGFKLRGFRVNEPPPLESSIEAYIFQIGHGRSILVSSRRGGGASIFDVGAQEGVDVSRVVNAITRTVTVGMVEGPITGFISHTDRDHINGFTRLLRQAEFSDMTVQVATEQLRSAIGAGDWSRTGITFNATQRLVEVQVTGTGGAAGRVGPQGGEVHIRRAIVGDMEITEFRSVGEHERAATGLTYRKNRTSPVTVITDLQTGERTLLTADMEPRQFSEIVNAIGDAAFLRILGAEGRNFRLAEIPHHGGRVAGQGNVRGMILMLQFAFEASDGSVRFFTQTSQAFSSGPSASIRFLDITGIDAERIMNDPSPPGESQARRVRGSEMETITFDPVQIQRVLSTAQRNESEVMRTYRLLAETRTLQEEVNAMHQVFNRSTAPREVVESLNQLRTELNGTETGIRNAVAPFWVEMEAAASGSEGMRANRDVARVTAELNTLRGYLDTVDLTRARNSVDAHVESLNAYGLVFFTMVQMWQALRAERYRELPRLRATSNELIQQARGILGRAVVHEHVRAAWGATRSHWTAERLHQFSTHLGSMARAQRIMMTEFHVELLESLGRQMQLVETAARAAHSGRQVYGRGGRVVTPARTRVGAGFLALLELFRLGAEMYTMVAAAAERIEEYERESRVEGVREVFWWIAQGATPTVALTKRHWLSGRYTVVSDNLSQSRILEIVSGRSHHDDDPEYDRAVVEDVPDNDLRFIINRQFLEARDLEDWITFNNRTPSHKAMFKQFPEGWGVRLWERDAKEYHYVARGIINDPLNNLMAQLEASSEERFAGEIAAAPGTEYVTVENTAIFSSIATDRYVFVFDSSGNPIRLDFEDHAPRFFAPRHGISIR